MRTFDHTLRELRTLNGTLDYLERVRLFTVESRVGSVGLWGENAGEWEDWNEAGVELAQAERRVLDTAHADGKRLHRTKSSPQGREGHADDA